MSTIATPTPTEAAADGPLLALVDGDVHPSIADVGVLRQHMSKRTARRVFGQDLIGRGLKVYARDPNRVPHPSSGLRLDAIPPRGGVPGSDPEYCNEQLMDRYDISAAVLTAIQSGSVIPWGDEYAGAEFVTAMNRYFLNEWCAFDGRYRLALNVSPYHIASAVAEVERFGDDPHVCAIFIPHGGVGMGRTAMFSLYEIAEDKGLPIVLHPTGAEGNLSAAPRLAGGLPYTYPERHSLLLQPGQAVMAAMIFGGVFDRFPKLKLVLSEYGVTWLSPMMFKMDQAYDLGDGELAGLQKRPSRYVAENIRFTSQPLDEPGDARQLWEVLEMVDAAHTLMFSSDYPHWDNDDPRLILDTRLPKHLRHRVAYGTAVECFGADRLGIAL